MSFLSGLGAEQRDVYARSSNPPSPFLKILWHSFFLIKTHFDYWCNTWLKYCFHSGYVERGVQVSITGFKARSWAERNAATLLFSALITRIFGVKREKDSDELSAKNCLTSRVFFHRYPSLHGFLLKCLEECVSTDKEVTAGTLELFPMLYPLLLLLSR